MLDPYAALGIQPDASVEAIKRAWKHIAKETHPDLHQDDPMKTARFKAANEAWTLLSDPKRKAAWDLANKASLHRNDHASDAIRIRQAFSGVIQVIFDAVIPSYLTKYHRGLDAELIWRLIKDLDQAQILDLYQSAPPSFASRQQAQLLKARFEFRVDPRIQTALDGTPRPVTVSWNQFSGAEAIISVWMGSIRAMNVVDPNAQETLLLLAVTKEILRVWESDLPPDLRVLAWRTEQGVTGFPAPMRTARSRDSRHINLVIGRMVGACIALAVSAWAAWWGISGTWALF